MLRRHWTCEKCDRTNFPLPVTTTGMYCKSCGHKQTVKGWNEIQRDAAERYRRYGIM